MADTTTFLAETSRLAPDDLGAMGPMLAGAVGARAARILIADYAHILLTQICARGETATTAPIEATMAGRVFLTGESLVSRDSLVTLRVPLSEGSERLGVVEIDFDDDVPDIDVVIAPFIRVLVLTLVSKRRYTDQVLRARRVRPLSIAAEMQWDLLPPLSCTTSRVAIGGRLDPAYATGGDSFDYALTADRLDLVIVDAVGHGMPAVLKTVAAINTLRNIRREGGDLHAAYHETDSVIADQFGELTYVTGLMLSLDLQSGEMTWVNAGHPLPLLVRNDTLLGELACQPSLPMGLGGTVREVKHDTLQRGDRVLFYTDGVIEGRSADRTTFGVERLGDLLVRETLNGVSTSETARRLALSIVEHSNHKLRDDATLVVLDYLG